MLRTGSSVCELRQVKMIPGSLSLFYTERQKFCTPLINARNSMGAYIYLFDIVSKVQASWGWGPELVYPVQFLLFSKGSPVLIFWIRVHYVYDLE